MYCIILTTTNEHSCAKNIARMLVEKKYAACVNIIPKVESIYRWEDNIVNDKEFLLIIKTHPHLFSKVTELIKSINTYETSESIMLGIKKGDKKYIDWLDSCLILPETKDKKEDKAI